MGTKYPNGEEIFDSNGQVNKPSEPVTGMRCGPGIQGLAMKWRIEALTYSLRWAVRHMEWPLMPDSDGHWWKACPGCRVIWTRDMQHDKDCEYLSAVHLTEPRK
jgi:hypothetical protein